MNEENEFKQERDHLKRYGEKLIENGYSIVPIQFGKKAPGFDGWQKSRSTKAQLEEWLKGGFKSAGVGILTAKTCAIDIDCNDELTAKRIEQFCFDTFGKAPVRIGKAPKRLLLYRTDTPFKKRRSTIYKDDWGDKQLIEVLAEGQQFVAFHVHPETGKPYTWVDGLSPLNLPAAELPELKPDLIDKLLDHFEAVAKEEKWEVLKVGRAFNGSASGSDNPWVEDTQPIDITIEELRSRLMLVPHPEDYDQWFSVGAALHHQFGGDQIGFDLWAEWSETADNYDADALERHWPTFDIEGKGRAPLTARFILRLAKEHIEKTANELSVKLKDLFINAKDLAEWEKARQAAREAEIDGLSRAALANVAKERRDAITGVKTSITEIRKAISYLPKKSEKTPSWAEGWVYDTSDDRFYHTEKHIAATSKGFDAMYDRQAMTKKDILDGKSSPSQSASQLALNLFKIPFVQGRRYMPGRDTIFHEPDGTYANTYPDHEIPAKPDKELPRDKRAVERVKAHLAHLLPNVEEQRMLLDWLSWVAQNPGRHVNYAVLLQGVEGDGKSFFGELMRAVMGVSNVTMLNNDIIHSSFSDWAHGQCLVCLEEVRIVGKMGRDKWETINKIKPFITNKIIEIHPKGAAVINVLNTTSYLLFSNYKDALPIDDNSRRYLVLFSRWQRREDIRTFKETNPDYYRRLYETLTESAGALRQWLLDHEQAESFDPMGDAPETMARSIMIRKAKPEFIQMLDEIVTEDETLAASSLLVDVTALSDTMSMRGVEWPSPKTLASMLERDGYESLGKVRLPNEGVHSFYSKSPEHFRAYSTSGPVTDPVKIRNYLKNRQAALDDDL